MQMLAPVLLTEDLSHKILCEGITLGETDDLLVAWSVWFSSYTIFNLSYQKTFKKILVFTEKFLLGIEDAKKTPQMVLELMEDIILQKLLAYTVRKDS